MRFHLHQTHHTVADFKGIYQYIEDFVKDVPEEGIHILPELFLSGYPLQDLCLNNSFILGQLKLFEKINNLFCGMSKRDDLLILMGGLKYSLTKDFLPEKLENVVYKVLPGASIDDIYSKILLPNYDIFDEKKYFTPGKTVKSFKWNNISIALMICEDMWPNTGYETNPVQELFERNEQYDVIINLSASPYNINKFGKRIKRASEISSQLKAPFVYVNRVGGEDEILFDGNSFLVNGKKLVLKAKAFKKDQIDFDLPKWPSNNDLISEKNTVQTTWESLFSPQYLKNSTGIPILKPLDDNVCLEVIDALGFGVMEYAKKCRFKKFIVALSGGLDSSLVLAILKQYLPKNYHVEAVYMPSRYSREISYSLSVDLCKKLEIPLHVLSINHLHEVAADLFKNELNSPLVGLADENIQSRLRSTLLLARANQTNAIAINTSNKSEIAVGYSTIYGDSIGAISMLGDVYKSEVYMLANFINRKFSNIIPSDIITRPPSAELRDGQIDTDSLPPYEKLDAILEGILSYKLSLKKLIEMGFSKEEVESVFKLYRNSEYKRNQFCPIIKIKAKSFGFGYRIPICKDDDFYFNN